MLDRTLQRIRACDSRTGEHGALPRSADCLLARGLKHLTLRRAPASRKRRAKKLCLGCRARTGPNVCSRRSRRVARISKLEAARGANSITERLSVVSCLKGCQWSVVSCPLFSWRELKAEDETNN